MEVYFTRHAKSRMRWRRITRDEVEQTLAKPDKREVIGDRRFHYYRRYGKRHLRITCVMEGDRCIVITAVDKGD